MKLSEKGYEKMFAWSGDPKCITFDQSDFEGVVVLSLDDVDTLIETMLEAEKRIDDEDTQEALDQAINFLGKEYAKTKNHFNKRR